jgi:CHAT domain-containing protein
VKTSPRLPPVWIAVAALALATAVAPVVPQEAPLETASVAERARRFDDAVDSLRRKPALRESLLAVADELMREAADASSDTARLHVLHARARLLVQTPPNPDEETTVLEGLSLARRTGHEIAEIGLLIQICDMYGLAGRERERSEHLTRLTELGERHQGTKSAAQADYFIARQRIAEGRPDDAKTLAERARPFFERGGDLDWVVRIDGLLGFLALNANDLPEGRMRFSSAIDVCRRIGRDDLLCFYLGNRGTLERNAGRYDRALADYEELKRTADRVGSAEQRGFAFHTMGVIFADLGRYADAVAQGDSLIALGREMRSPDHRARGHVVSLFAHAEAGRFGEAAQHARRVVAMGDSIHPSQRLDAALNLGSYLLELDSLDVAYDLVRRIEREARGFGIPYELRFANLRSHCLMRLGRTREAIATIEEVRPKVLAGTPASVTTDMLSHLAGLYTRMGAGDSAAACLAHARESYFRNRANLPDQRWRERIGEEGSFIAGAELRRHLGRPGMAADPEAAFNAVEPLRARTLVERIAGRSGALADSGFATAARLREALAPGEVLLQWTVTRDTSVLFAFTREETSVYPMGIAADSLELQARELRTQLGRAPARDERARIAAIEAATGALARRLLGPVAQLVRAASRVVVAPDASLYQLPMATLLATAAFEGDVDAVPDLATVPSATLLLRARSGAAPGAVVGLLAASGPAPGTADPLEGGAREVRWLDRSFDPVTVLIAPRDGTDSLGFEGYAGIHFAGHAEANDVLPWQSGILLGGGDGDGYVRASTIAAMRIPARLAVLSACETAWGAVLSGEGLIGMSTAFLSAGVPTVVATQWRVPDRETIDFMKVFYREIATGSTAASALRRARAAMRSGPHRDPYYWAGFVLVGEPGTTLELSPRGTPTGAILGLLAVLLAALAGFVVLRRGRVRAE